MALNKKVDYIALAGQVLETEAAAILAARGRLGESFVRAVEILFSVSATGRIVLSGMGKSGHIARKIAATLASTGTPSLFVHPAEAGHGDLGMITRHDAVIAISQSGNSDELLRLIPYLKRNRISIIAMTGSSSSPLARHADATISTAVDKEACPIGLAPTTSTTLTLALGDAVAMCLLEARGFTAEQFAFTHPHGALGRRLMTSIDDVMVRGDAVPMVAGHHTIRQVLIEMSRAGLGFVNVVDSSHILQGMFTDGDLRRALDRDVDIKSQVVSSVMSKNFVTAKASQLAVEAVEAMEGAKISALPIVDDRGAVVGALNMRLLLQAGVI